MELNLMYMYPDLLNLYGDRGNILAINRICGQLEIKFNLNRINDIDTELDFANTDIVLFSPGQLSTFPVIIHRLREDYEEQIKKYVENDKYIIALGTSACIFADGVKRINRQSYRGLGIGQYDCIERVSVYGDDLIYKCTPTDKPRTVAGNQIQMVDTVLKDGGEPFGKIVYGLGNNKTGDDGSRYRNLITTNALGPVFIKNPWFIADIIVDVMKKKGFEIDESKLDFSLEEKSLAAVEKFNSGKKTDL